MSILDWGEYAKKSNDNPSGIPRQKEKLREILGNHGQGQDYDPAFWQDRHQAANQDQCIRYNGGSQERSNKADRSETG